MRPEGALFPEDRLDKPVLGFMAVVARNSAFVLASQILIRIIAFAFNVYVVRRLGAVQFGRYSIVMAYVALFGIFTDLGLAPYSVREIAEDPAKMGWLVPNSVAIRGLLSLVIAVIAPLSALWLGKEDYLVWGILIASLGQLVWAVQGPLGSALIARERLDYDALFSIVERLVFWILGALALLSGAGFIALILASLAGVAARAVLSGWVLLSRLGMRDLELSGRRWPSMLRGALPFGISGIAFTLRQQFDTILMSFVLTDQEVGWYNVPFNLIGMLLLMAVSIGQAMYPSMARARTTDPAAMRRLTHRAAKYLLAMSLPITVGGIMLARPIVVTLYTEEFTPSVLILQIILLALPALFLLELLGRLANALHLERQLARVTIINAAITVALNVALVPTLGALGAALALVIGRLVNLIQNVVLVGRDQLLGENWSDVPGVFLAAAGMGVLVFTLREAHLAISIGAGALLYGLLLLAFGVLTRRELVELAHMMPGAGRARRAAGGTRK
jgi:O-antigen/teichoic acid export membrane protein